MSDLLERLEALLARLEGHGLIAESSYNEGVNDGYAECCRYLDTFVTDERKRREEERKEDERVCEEVIAAIPPDPPDPRDALLAQAREALNLGNQYCLGDYGTEDEDITAAIAAIDKHMGRKT